MVHLCLYMWNCSEMQPEFIHKIFPYCSFLQSGNVEVDRECQDIENKPHPRTKIALAMTATETQQVSSTVHSTHFSSPGAPFFSRRCFQEGRRGSLKPAISLKAFLHKYRKMLQMGTRFSASDWIKFWDYVF